MIVLPIPKERKLYLANQVDQASINQITKAIIDINEDDPYINKIAEASGFKYEISPILLYIDSYGGLVYQCFGLLSVMKNSKVPIHTITTGCAMSCGFLIAISGHKRFCYEKATYMYHQVSSATWGKAKDMEETIIETKRLQKMIEEHTLDNTHISKKQLKETYEGKKDWFMSSKEALSLGVVDVIL